MNQGKRLSDGTRNLTDFQGREEAVFLFLGQALRKKEGACVSAEGLESGLERLSRV